MVVSIGAGRFQRSRPRIRVAPCLRCKQELEPRWLRVRDAVRLTYTVQLLMMISSLEQLLQFVCSSSSLSSLLSAFDLLVFNEATAARSSLLPSSNNSAQRHPAQQASAITALLRRFRYASIMERQHHWWDGWFDTSEFHARRHVLVCERACRSSPMRVHPRTMRALSNHYVTWELALQRERVDKSTSS